MAKILFDRLVRPAGKSGDDFLICDLVARPTAEQAHGRENSRLGHIEPPGLTDRRVHGAVPTEHRPGPARAHGQPLGVSFADARGYQRLLELVDPGPLEPKIGGPLPSVTAPPTAPW